jgi:DNA end-binding protein Ku
VAKPRSLWTGSISFGLVNIPVRLYTATVSHDIGFHQFQAKSGHRIHYKRVAEGSGREVPFDQIVKGYEVSKGKLVLIEPEELDAIEPKKTRTIEIEEFVSLQEIDPVLWAETYYIGPEGKSGADKAYELLRRAMEETGKVGIGRFVMRTKEYLATIRPLGRGLALETMFYQDEVRDLDEVVDLPKRPTVAPKEVGLARQLIESLSATWDPKKFEDTYRDRVMELIKKKARGEAIVQETVEEPKGQVIDLMEALKSSLGAMPKKRGSRRATSGATSRSSASAARRREARSRARA